MSFTCEDRDIARDGVSKRRVHELAVGILICFEMPVARVELLEARFKLSELPVRPGRATAGT